MTISLTSGERNHQGAFLSSEDMTNSTGTGLQELSLDDPISTISGGTATGFGVNRYLLSTASAVEGQEKTVMMLATGEAYLVMTGTATGALVYLAANDFTRLRYQNESWMQMANLATIATATGTA